MNSALPAPASITEQRATRPSIRATRGTATLARMKAMLGQHRVLAGVLLVFAATIALLPIRLGVMIGDDWVYVRAVENLVRDHTLDRPYLSAANAVFEQLWGGLFAAVLGLNVSVLRVSTLVLSMIGGAAVYGVSVRLGISRHRAALASALYLFNPLNYVMSFSFMTDPHFAALLAVAAYGYVRGFDATSAEDRRWTLLGSAAAAFALLSRQQGVFIPISVAVYLLGTRRIRFNRAGSTELARVAALPFLAFLFFQLFLSPSGSESLFTSQFSDAGLSGASHLVRHLTYIQVMYIGFFLLPVGLALLPQGRHLLRSLSPLGWFWFAILEAVLVAGLTVYSTQHKNMPYIFSWFTWEGLGPSDVVGRRGPLLGANVGRAQGILTLGSAVSAFVVGLAVLRAASTRSQERARAGLVGALLGGMAIGVVIPSFTFAHANQPSLDRYLLPLLPLCIILAFWAMVDIKFTMVMRGIAAGLGVAVAVFSVVGTYDLLVMNRTIWRLGEAAVEEEGAQFGELDAGPGFTLYHTHDRIERPPAPFAESLGSWWIRSDGYAVDQRYVVSTIKLDGYRVVRTARYPSVLRGEFQVMYLLLREGPPSAPGA